jgi:hypothetical protein
MTTHATHASSTFGRPNHPRAKRNKSVGGALSRCRNSTCSRDAASNTTGHRGLFWWSRADAPNCLCTVDGEPNVRICTLAGKKTASKSIVAESLAAAGL